MRSTNTGYFFLFIASMLLSLLFCPPVAGLWDDDIVFRYAGMLISKGGIPYIDLFDHKPPLIFFLNWLGDFQGSWGTWMIDALFTAAATLFFYKRCRERQLAFPFILPLLFNLLLRNYFVCYSVGMTREYTAIFLLIAFCVMVNRSRYTFFWLGLLAAATFFMQQEQLLTFLPFYIYAIIADLSTTRRFLTNVTQSAAGCLLIVAPIIVYFSIHHALTAFWRDAFLFNFQWYAEKQPLGEQFRAIHAALTISEVGIVLLISSTLALTAIFLRPKQSGLILTALLATGLAFAPELISGRMAAIPDQFYYYLAPLSATLPILLFTVWTTADHSFLNSRISHAVFGFLICAPMLYNALQRATHLRLDNGGVVRNTPEYQFLRRQSPSDYQVYIFGQAIWPVVYNDFRILAPSPWIYHHFWKWYPHWDADLQIITAIGRDLLAHRTRYVVDCSGQPGSYFADPAAFRCWKTFLQEHYHPVYLNGSPGITLWQLNGDTDKNFGGIDQGYYF